MMLRKGMDPRSEKKTARVKSLFSRFLSPERIFISGFAGYILLGTLFLWLPLSAAEGPIPFIDALFTSTSAVCVTGLVTIDVGQSFSFFGQVVTILLFQVGGLGIITFSTVFFVMMGRGISFKGRDIVQSTFLHTPQADFMVILKSVLLFTVFFESIGVLLLWYRFCYDFPVGQAFYQAVYHAISAFNNCGLSLFADSLVRYQGDFIVNLTVMGLIVVGGIGFVVQHEIFAKLRGRKRRLSVHTRIVLLATGILLVGGALFIYIFERNHILYGMPLRNQILAVFFQSVAPRTAGFSTVDIGFLTNETILLMIVLMFIGASPGSTGGGVKTTSASLLFLLMWARLRGREEVNVFKRTIPRDLISRTIAIIFASGFCVSLVTSLLLFASPGEVGPLESRRFFVEYLFETVSAFGTVGLSMGVTPDLKATQKLAVIFMMFAGRVGPLTLAFSFSRKAMTKRLTYAEEGIMVG
jgi:trk system potassium uptake protein TrkH